MAPLDTARCLPCRHSLAEGSIERMIRLLTNLREEVPDLIERYDIPLDAESYAVVFSTAVESIRGTHAATTQSKKRFIEAILDFMTRGGYVAEWEFIGSGGRQDYRAQLLDGTDVGIEAKGCPDGNNMTIWERPAWANEFIVWSQCPESLRHHPGKGTWSGVSIRLLPKSIAEGVVVDAMLFWDGRCGSDIRRCPKSYGVEGEGLRPEATNIPGQGGRDWIPPPCVYLFPRTVARAPGNPSPAPHTSETCKFAGALLAAFNVPADEQEAYVHSAHVEMELRPQGRYIRPSVDVAQPGEKDSVQGDWKRLRRE